MPAAIWDLLKEELEMKTHLHAHAHDSCHGFRATEGPACRTHRPPWGKWPADGPSSACSSKAGQLPDPFSVLKSNRRDLDRLEQTGLLRKNSHPLARRGQRLPPPRQIPASRWFQKWRAKFSSFPASFLCPLATPRRSPGYLSR